MQKKFDMEKHGFEFIGKKPNADSYDTTVVVINGKEYPLGEGIDVDALEERYAARMQNYVNKVLTPAGMEAEKVDVPEPIALAVDSELANEIPEDAFFKANKSQGADVQVGDKKPFNLELGFVQDAKGNVKFCIHNVGMFEPLTNEKEGGKKGAFNVAIGSGKNSPTTPVFGLNRYVGAHRLSDNEVKILAAGNTLNGVQSVHDLTGDRYSCSIRLDREASNRATRRKGDIYQYQIKYKDKELDKILGSKSRSKSKSINARDLEVTVDGSKETIRFQLPGGLVPADDAALKAIHEALDGKSTKEAISLNGISVINKKDGQVSEYNGVVMLDTATRKKDDSTYVRITQFNQPVPVKVQGKDTYIMSTHGGRIFDAKELQSMVDGKEIDGFTFGPYISKMDYMKAVSAGSTPQATMCVHKVPEGTDYSKKPGVVAKDYDPGKIMDLVKELGLEEPAANRKAKGGKKAAKTNVKDVQAQAQDEEQKG